MKKKIFIYLLMLCTVSFAYSIDKNKYAISLLTGQAKYSTFNKFHVPDSLAVNFVGISLESYFNNSFSLELGYQYYLNKDNKFAAPLNHSAEMMLNYYTNNDYLFSTKAFLSPYIAVGLGYHQTYDKVKDNRKDYFSGVGKVGLNLRWSSFLSTQITMKSEVPVIGFENSDFFKSDYLYNSFSVSLKYNFGKPAKRKFVAPVFYAAKKSEYDYLQSNKITQKSQEMSVDVAKVGGEDSKVVDYAKLDSTKQVKSPVVKQTQTKKTIRINDNGSGLNILVEDGDDFRVEYNKNDMSIDTVKKVAPGVKKVTAKKKTVKKRKEVAPKVTENDTTKTFPYRNDTVLYTPPANNYGVPVKAKVERRVDTVYIQAQPVERETVRIIEREVQPYQSRSDVYQGGTTDPVNNQYYSRPAYENYPPVKDERMEERANVSTENVSPEKEVEKEPFYKRVKAFFTGKPKDQKQDTVMAIQANVMEKEEVVDSMVVLEKTDLKELKKEMLNTDSINNIIQSQQDSIRILVAETEKLLGQLEGQKEKTSIVKEQNVVKDSAPSTLMVIYYENGQVKVPAKSRELLNEKMMDLASASKIILEGHTDKSGTEKTNIKVSNLRINHVANYLMNNGIATEKIVRKAYGEQFATQMNSISERKVVVKVQ